MLIVQVAEMRERIHEVIAAVRRKEPVLIMEGERRFARIVPNYGDLDSVEQAHDDHGTT